MKKPILLALLCLLATFGCKSRDYAMIGMSESEFIQHNHSAERVQATESGTIYRTSKIILASNRHNIKYYYFVDGKLKRIDEGVRQPDLIIENNHNN